jgi:hypothetical protein
MTTNLPKTLASLQAHGFQTLTPEQATQVIYRPEFILAFRLEPSPYEDSQEEIHMVSAAFKHISVPIIPHAIVSLGFCGSSIIINQKAFSVTDFLKDPCSIIKNIAQ